MLAVTPRLTLGIVVLSRSYLLVGYVYGAVSRSLKNSGFSGRTFKSIWVLCVREGGFDVFGILTGHSDISALGSFGLFGFAEIVVILSCGAANHFALLGNLYFLSDGFSSFLLHRKDLQLITINS